MKNLKEYFFNLIGNMHNNSIAKFIYNKTKEECLLSPLLFNIALEILLKAIR